MPSSNVVASLVTRIRSREQLYRSALRGDIAQLKREFVREPVREAMKLLGARDDGNRDEWDSLGHSRAVRLLRERRHRGEDFFNNGR